MITVYLHSFKIPLSKILANYKKKKINFTVKNLADTIFIKGPLSVEGQIESSSHLIGCSEKTASLVMLLV